MSKSKKVSTQTNKQFRKTDMSTGAKCKTETSKKNRNTLILQKPRQKIGTAPGKRSKQKVSAFKNHIPNGNSKHIRKSA